MSTPLSAYIDFAPTNWRVRLTNRPEQPVELSFGVKWPHEDRQQEDVNLGDSGIFKTKRDRAADISYQSRGLENILHGMPTRDRVEPILFDFIRKTIGTSFAALNVSAGAEFDYRQMFAGEHAQPYLAHVLAAANERGRFFPFPIDIRVPLVVTKTIRFPDKDLTKPPHVEAISSPGMISLRFLSFLLTRRDRMRQVINRRLIGDLAVAFFANEQWGSAVEHYVVKWCTRKADEGQSPTDWPEIGNRLRAEVEVERSLEKLLESVFPAISGLFQAPGYALFEKLVTLCRPRTERDKEKLRHLLRQLCGTGARGLTDQEQALLSAYETTIAAAPTLAEKLKPDIDALRAKKASAEGQAALSSEDISSLVEWDSKLVDERQREEVRRLCGTVLDKTSLQSLEPSYRAILALAVYRGRSLVEFEPYCQPSLDRLQQDLACMAAESSTALASTHTLLRLHYGLYLLRTAYLLEAELEHLETVLASDGPVQRGDTLCRGAACTGLSACPFRGAVRFYDDVEGMAPTQRQIPEKEWANDWGARLNNLDDIRIILRWIERLMTDRTQRDDRIGDLPSFSAQLQDDAEQREYLNRALAALCVRYRMQSAEEERTVAAAYCQQRLDAGGTPLRLLRTLVHADKKSTNTKIVFEALHALPRMSLLKQSRVVKRLPHPYVVTIDPDLMIFFAQLALAPSRPGNENVLKISFDRFFDFLADYGLRPAAGREALSSYLAQLGILEKHSDAELGANYVQLPF